MLIAIIPAEVGVTAFRRFTDALPSLGEAFAKVAVIFDRPSFEVDFLRASAGSFWAACAVPSA